MNSKVCLAVLTGVASLMAIGYDDWQPKENCYLLQASDSKNYGSSFELGGHWPNGVLPTSDQDCWVPAKLTIRGSNIAFPGKSLTVEGSFDATYAYVTSIANIRFLGGSILSYSSVPNGLSGDATIENSSAKNPVYIKLTRNNVESKAYPSIRKWIAKSANDKLIIQSTTKNPALVPQFSGPANFNEFMGTLRIERTADSLSEGYMLASNTVATTLTIPNRLELGKGEVFRRNGTSNGVTVGNLSLEEGSIISTYIGADVKSFITVTNRIEIEEGARYRLHCTENAYNPLTLKLFALGDAITDEEAIAEVRKLTIEEQLSNYWGLDWELNKFKVYTDAIDGRYVVFNVGRPVRALSKTASAISDTESSVLDASYWTGNVLPNANENAFFGANATFCQDLDKTEFPAGGVIVSETYLVINCPRITFRNLFLRKGEMRMSDKRKTYSGKRGSTVLVKGDYLGVYGDADAENMIGTMSGSIYTFDYPIYGNAPLRLTVRSGTSYPFGGIELVQTNVNFHGKMTIASDGNVGVVNSETGYRLRLYLTDARNLGGSMSVPTFNGLTLRGDSILVCDNSINFNQENRGVYVQDRIRVVMANRNDDTFTITNPLTYGGEFVFGNDYPNATSAKVGKGGGTLVLAGAARFYDSET